MGFNFKKKNLQFDAIGFKEILIKIEVLESILKNIVPVKALKYCYPIVVGLFSDAYSSGLQENNVSFTIAIKFEKLLFLCENLVYSKNVEKLQNKIDKQDFNKEDLKMYYIKRLRNNKMEDKISHILGYGIEFNSSVRKHCEKIVYNFSEIDIDTSMFSIIITLSIKSIN